MWKSKWLVCVGVCMFAGTLSAATYFVTPGMSVQETLDNALPGDTINIMEGVYDENIIVTKKIKIVGETGKEVKVSGTWAFNAPPDSVYVIGLILGKSGASGITVTDCKTVKLEGITVSFGGGITVTNSEISIYKSTFEGAASFTNSAWEFVNSTTGALTSDTSDTKIVKSTIHGNLSHNDPTKDLTVFQSTIDEKLYCKATKYHICYNTIQFIEVDGGEGEIIGNTVDGRSFYVNQRMSHLIKINNSVSLISNNLLKNLGIYKSYDCGSTAITCSGDIKIFNNIITGMNSWVNGSIGISSTALTLEIKGNIIYGFNGYPYGPLFAVNANSSGAICNFNNFWGLGVTGGIVPTNCINTDPLFVSGTYQLQAGSPCKNTGPTGAEYNNHDGTRNDMGIYGGHSYDPDGMTTVKPVVLERNAAPVYVRQGGTFELNAKGGVAK